MNEKVDSYIENLKAWKPEIEGLREILLACGLTEEFKWKQPCYMYKKSNLVLLYHLKDACALGFMKGVLLKDTDKLLNKPGENSQSSRWIKLTSMKEIEEQETVIKTYVYEAIEIEKAGIKVDFKAKNELVYPEEFQKILDANREFAMAFEALTPGRQRGYNLFFSGAKQSQTRVDRIQSNIQRILDGYGIRDCTCGHSKRMPTCDGSHKYL
ncbi:MAG: hypothetical protein ACI9IP_001648 [Arcticibacterium sp.]|jgi:uncharacterized protein YdeI (YjbR/CyaY-like superfamily)